MKKFLAIEFKNRILILAFLLLGLLSLAVGLLKDSEPRRDESPTGTPSVDTFIPRGHVLVPIELSNAESLSSLVGDIGGVVDLYLAGEKNRPGRKVGSKLKLLRAPLNPQQYAVLVKDQDSQQLLSFAGPFVAVIQNPETQGQQVAGPHPRQIRIDYQN